MAAVTVWTQPDCIQCDQTKRRLDKAGLTYEEIPLTDELREKFRTEHGFSSAPVVRNNATGEHWAGFKVDKLRGLRHRFATHQE